jgi:hypothetical protein
MNTCKSAALVGAAISRGCAQKQTLEVTANSETTPHLLSAKLSGYRQCTGVVLRAKRTYLSNVEGEAGGFRTKAVVRFADDETAARVVRDLDGV